ncbi:MAG TPA: DUF5655 domain-containing protein [Rickettsiales bacterium]|nr:DUF5655 domain-containing protein [Rickettsiales bacterium]
MTLYINKNSILEKINEKPFVLEREIQKIFEKNLKTISGLTFVKSEFPIKDKRLDTLAFDEQSKAFVIIEYKRNRNESVVDQGFTYLNLMLENKAEFIMEYNEELGRKLKRDDVDWSQTRVIFVSTFFTDNQIQATNFKDIAIELWEVKRYADDVISINSIKKSKSTGIKSLAKNDTILKKVTNEIKVYTEEEHLSGASEEIVELYERFKDAILNLADGMEIEPKKIYIAFKKDNSNVCDISIQKKSLKIFLNGKKGSLDDPKKIARDISSVGHHGNGDYELAISDDRNLEYIMSLIKQILL